jgi:hypothetical protein
LALGAGTLARGGVPHWPPVAAAAAGIVLLAFGAGCAAFFLRYCLARVLLSDRGFVLTGPLRAPEDVPWSEVVAWRRVRIGAGPATLRIVHGPGRRRLSVPMIYEDSHLLEIGLGQGRFPMV